MYFFLCFGIVLTTGSAHHFLTNVPRTVKTGLIGKDVKVVGKKRTNGIFVDSIESKTGRLIYSWEAEHYDPDDRGPFIRGWDPLVGYY